MKALLMIFAILALTLAATPSAEAAGCNPGRTFWSDLDGGVNCLGQCIMGNTFVCLLDNLDPCREPWQCQ